MLLKATLELPPAEKEAIQRAAEAALMKDTSGVLQAVQDLTVLLYRTSQKARRDAREDARRRTLVGARLSRETAERVKLAAAREGVSMYQYVSDAIFAHLMRDMCKENCGPLDGVLPVK